MLQCTNASMVAGMQRNNLSTAIMVRYNLVRDAMQPRVPLQYSSAGGGATMELLGSGGGAPMERSA